MHTPRRIRFWILLNVAVWATAFGVAVAGAGRQAARVGGMSSAVPYVAPWDTSFKRYSTQILLPSFPLPTLARLAVPDGQWWRIVYVQGELGTSAVVANRTVKMTVEKTSGVFLFQETMPGSQPASGFGVYLLGPGITGYANTTDITAAGYDAALPDLLWPPGSIISLLVANAQANDGWQGRVNFAVEVYTQAKDDPASLVPVPLVL